MAITNKLIDHRMKAIKGSGRVAKLADGVGCTCMCPQLGENCGEWPTGLIKSSKPPVWVLTRL